ncbi:uncharacterized protein BDV17DRAFT_290200 [Aspergillus undulatus]|uniref:uncharacterized protein n=1 Tax=Aspergillus undulatus TaxID=1810928 RepID=UPI003CCD76BD
MAVSPVPITLAEVSYFSGVAESVFGQKIRTRRTCRSSSDECPLPVFDGFIEEDFRAGGPRLCEAPRETILQVPDTIPQYRALSDPARDYSGQIETIATNEGLKIVEKNPSHRGWIGISRKILANLTKNVINNFAVEIINPRFEQKPRLFPCLTTDHIYEAWGRVGPAIIDQIDLTGVCTVGCYRIGMNNDHRQCPVTVLVGVDRWCQRDWKPTREVIVRILDNSGLSTVGDLIRLDGITTSVNTAFERGGGTFGGWVEVRHPKTGNWLTLGHVVIAFWPQTWNSRETTGRWKENGVSVGDKQTVSSKAFLKERVDYLDRRIKYSTDQPEFQEVERLKKADEIIQPGQEKRWSMIKAMNAPLEKERRRLKEDYQKKDPNPQSLASQIDWELVKPQGQPATKNKIRQHFSPSKLFDFSLKRIQPDTKLFKVGTKTGLTQGEYGGLQECTVTPAKVDGQDVFAKTWNIRC